MGYFFCKPPKDVDITLFKVSDEPEAEICFDAFYGSDDKVNVEAIRKFLVGVVGEDNIKNPKATEVQTAPVTE